MYLGYLITANAVQPSPDKVSALATLAAPTNVKLLRSF